MKYPKLWNGPSAIGESDVRSLEGLDMPFAKTVQLGSISRKRNGFNEVYTGGFDPYLWGLYVARPSGSGVTTFGAQVDPYDTDWLRYTFRREPQPRGFAASDPIYIGDGYLLALRKDSPGYAGTELWPVIHQASGMGVTGDRPATSFYGEVTFSGLWPQGHAISMCALGWQNSSSRYKFGFASLRLEYPDDPTRTNATPAAYHGNTGGRTMTRSTYPFYPDRNHYPFTIYTAGSGKAHALNCVKDEQDLFDPAKDYPKKKPYMTVSTDFGGNFSYVDAEFLTPFVYIDRHTEAADGRTYYNNSQLKEMSSGAMIIYVGSGITLLIITNGYIDGDPAGLDINNANFAPVLFVGSGGSYTRQNWPCDTWHTRYWDGAPKVSGAPSLKLPLSPGMRSGPFAFREGHAYIPVDNGGPCAMITSDFGSSWEFVPVPAEIAIKGSFAGVVVKPYESATKPERMVFPVPSYASRRMRFVETRDSMRTFKKTGPVFPSEALSSYSTEEGSPNYVFRYYGGRTHKDYVIPSFPGEFDEP